MGWQMSGDFPYGDFLLGHFHIHSSGIRETIGFTEGICLQFAPER